MVNEALNSTLRSLQRQDLDEVRGWRNNKNINSYMFSQHEISAAEHIAWFEANSQNPLTYLWVYLEQNQLQGFVQVQQKSTESKVFEWGFYVSPTAVSGTGTRMLTLAKQKVFSDLQADKLFAEVLGFNEASIHLHNKLGFVLEGCLRQQHRLEKHYQDVFCFGLLKPEWLASL